MNADPFPTISGAFQPEVSASAVRVRPYLLAISSAKAGSSVFKRPVLCLLASVLGIVAHAQSIHVVDGNVGIGTTTPQAKLEVNGTSRFDASASFAIDGATLFHTAKDGGATGGIVAESGKGLYLGANNSLSTGIFINGSGNVGLGTTTPGSTLDVNGTALFASTATFAVGGHTLFHTAKDGGATGGIVAESGKGLYLGANNSLSTGILINGGGNVGLGTTNPQEKLEVAGNIFLNPADKYLKIFANTEGTDSIVFARSDNSHQASIATTAFGKSILFKVGGGEIVRFRNDGNVGIGTTNPSYKLEVAGTVRATSFVSNTTTYADFVFKPGYRLAPLSEVEAHIGEHGHLPGIPSEAEALAQGVDLAAMQVKLLQKVEELTLHLIRLEKENAALQQRLRALEEDR